MNNIIVSITPTKEQWELLTRNGFGKKQLREILKKEMLKKLRDIIEECEIFERPRYKTSVYLSRKGDIFTLQETASPFFVKHTELKNGKEHETMISIAEAQLMIGLGEKYVEFLGNI
jgi:hypothetical protein